MMYPKTVEVQVGTKPYTGDKVDMVGKPVPDRREMTVEAAFGPNHERLSGARLIWRISAAREYLTNTTTTFRHYDGHHYKVTGFHTDASDGCVRVEYRDIDHSHGSVFSNPLLRFIEDVAPGMPRMTPVWQVNRYETRDEIKDRDGIDVEKNQPIG